MSKRKSSEIAHNIQTGWEPILAYAREALAEATTKTQARKITRGIEICERNIAAGVCIVPSRLMAIRLKRMRLEEARLNKRGRTIATSTHK
jgi:hypothetical protein